MSLLLGTLAEPAVGLGMAVGEGKATASVVVSARGIQPDGLLHAERKGPVVEAPLIFIHQHPEHGRPRSADSGELAVCEPGRIAAVSMFGVVQPGTVYGQGR